MNVAEGVPYSKTTTHESSFPISVTKVYRATVDVVGVVGGQMIPQAGSSTW